RRPTRTRYTTPISTATARHSLSACERMTLSSLGDVFPVFPLVESPLFHAIINELHLSPDERRVATELHERGYAVIDFSDDQIEARIERIQDYLRRQFDVDMADPDAIKNSGKVQRVQDAWAYDDDIRAIAAN